MPGLLELATGAGKSHIVAAIAHWVYNQNNKRVLCLQPSKELTEQNHAKYLDTGNPASVYSASAGAKCMRHPVVYGTPQTVKNNLSKFGDQFGAVIIDEAHGITKTIQMIVEHMRTKNPKLRVIGMTATPYRTGTGYIYQYDENGDHVDETQAKDPYFNTLLYKITTGELIKMGFLTPAHADPDHAASYEALSIDLNNRGQFEQKDLERVFEGRGRLTSEIVGDVVNHAKGRRGVMLFAATVQHAKEILESLPPDVSRMLGGDVNMKKADREKLISDFKAQRFKYIVSVATLTTGFDAPHVDLIAILRPTESPGLLQQIIGRGLRLYDDKEDCLVLDYAENIERHGLHDDLFKPTIRVSKGSEGGQLEAVCPMCSYRNRFAARHNPDDLEHNEHGYFVDLHGIEIQSDHGPMPAHYGRRCYGQVKSILLPGTFERCDYRWTSKECPHCKEDNDIAARYCMSCKQEIVDPNEKLRRDFVRVKKDPYSISTDELESWKVSKSVSRSGNDTLRCEFVTKYRSFTVWFTPSAKHQRAKLAWEMLSKAVFKGHIAPDVDTFIRFINRGSQPLTVTYAKKRNSEFFEVYAFNRPADLEPIE